MSWLMYDVMMFYFSREMTSAIALLLFTQSFFCIIHSQEERARIVVPIKLFRCSFQIVCMPDLRITSYAVKLL